MLGSRAFKMIFWLFLALMAVLALAMQGAGGAPQLVNTSPFNAGVLGARTLRGNRNAARDRRSLTNTFPFNAQDGEEHHAHGDHHGHHGEHHEWMLIPTSIWPGNNWTVKKCLLKTLGKASMRKKNLFFWALPESPHPPWPQFGQLGPFFSDVKIQDLKVSLELRILYILCNILYICNLKNS